MISRFSTFCTPIFPFGDRMGIYWDIYNTLSFHALFNWIIGNRGPGKTYGCKMWAIDDFLKNGKEFIYLRRYKTELKKDTKFFDDIRDRYPNIELEVKQHKAYINKKLAGYMLPLSTGITDKSVPYNLVNKIIFDEFIIDKGCYHYLPDEVTTFLEFYETIARMRDVTVFFLGNAISTINPYFLYFDLRLPFNKSIICKDDKLIELVQNKDFIAAKKETRFGKLVAGSDYEKYSIENQFLRDNPEFIEKKSSTARYWFTYIYNSEFYGVYIDLKEGKAWVSMKADRNCPACYAVTTADHTPNTILLKSRDKPRQIKQIIEMYQLGALRFESQKIKESFRNILKWVSI